LSMLPRRRKTLKLENSDLMIWRIRCLLFLRINGLPFDRSPPRGIDALRVEFIRPPQNLIHPMNSPVAERSIRVIEVVSEAPRMDSRPPRIRHVFAVVPQRRGTAP